MSKGFGAAALAVVIVLAWGTAVAAQETRSGLSAIDVFALADQALSEKRPVDAETLLAALTRDPDVEVRSEARFRLGMLLSGEGRNAEAATLFRALLDEKPDAVRVRLELARVLAEMGRTGEAKRAVAQAQSSGLLPPQAVLVVDQFAAAIRSTQPFGGSMEVGVAPDSNINRATQARTLDTVIAPLVLSEDARAQTGVGARLAGQAYARARLSEHITVLPRVSLEGDLYKQSEFDSASAAALLGLERQSARGARIAPSLSHTWRWFGGQPYASTDGLTIDGSRPLGRQAQLVGAVSASQTNYRTNDLQDGWLYAGQVSLERAVSVRGGLGASAQVARQTARDPGYATWTEGATVYGWGEAFHSTLGLSATVRRLDGDAAIFLFPNRRREWFYQVSASATVRRAAIGSFAPLVRLTFERNQSSVGLYDYRRLAATFGVARAF